MASILLLAGGDSSEREVSLRSGAAVTTALQQKGHHVDVLDPSHPIDDETYRNAAVIFPVLHGLGGEDGTLQAKLEALGLNNFVGSDAASSELCFDKWRYKQLLQTNGVITPAGALVNEGSVSNQPLAQQPFVIKPYNGGSSVDTFIIRDVAMANFAGIQAAVTRNQSMLLEQLITGVEITVGIVGDRALPVIEIIPPADGEFDYQNKYNGKTQELCPPEHVSAEIQQMAQALAQRIHQLCGCRDFSRTDMIVTAQDELYVLETNTIPGMTDQSLLPRAAATAGMGMPELCDTLVQLALQRA